MNKSLANGVAGLAKAYAAAFAAGAVARGAKQLIDTATRIDNALKVAGLSGEELNRVYARLFQSATLNAAPLESLVTLYGRAALVQKELDVSTKELLGFQNVESGAFTGSSQHIRAEDNGIVRLSVTTRSPAARVGTGRASTLRSAFSRERSQWRGRRHFLFLCRRVSRRLQSSAGIPSSARPLANITT